MLIVHFSKIKKIDIKNHIKPQTENTKKKKTISNTIIHVQQNRSIYKFYINQRC